MSSDTKIMQIIDILFSLVVLVIDVSFESLVLFLERIDLVLLWESSCSCFENIKFPTKTKKIEITQDIRLWEEDECIDGCCLAIDILLQPKARLLSGLRILRWKV